MYADILQPASPFGMLTTAMSTNSELVRKGYAAWNHDDLEGWLELVCPDVELQTSGIWPDFDAIYRGREGLAEFWRRMHEAWEVFRIDIEQMHEQGDCFVVALRFRAIGVGSGVDVDLRFANAIRMRDGLLAELISGRTVKEAREALQGRQPTAGR